ncbi:phospho-sugar mutase [Marisediminicola senii]|uniref:phospho-sugar mutase n=1 Tax=Marisediminicola senii TaxID=2711233 RepID=UPI00191275FD|nr:phospho-sugar mutase [Marisediminicola senii]
MSAADPATAGALDRASLDLLIGAARAWVAQDPDPVTAAELNELIVDAEAGTDRGIRALRDRFDTRLEFGTAGLRGIIGAGPNRMNRVLVSQAAAGLAAYLLNDHTVMNHATSRADTAGNRTPSVVIGYDGRTNSRAFAVDTAEIMAGAGVRAILLPRMLPTPVLAFAVRHLDLSAGVMVTASHNPAGDNGYKVYLGGEHGGSQIVSPADGEIAARIHLVAAGPAITELPRSTDYETAPETVVDEYVGRTAALATRPSTRVRFAYTAMHGVGWEIAQRVFAEAGFTEPVSVLEQQHPDPAFPTVAFPNPEEPGALDLAMRTATDAGVDLIVANDPDADRLAIAIPDAGAADGSGWRRLSGNEVGAILGWRAAERLLAADADGTLAASLVSSPALKAIADAYDLDFVETLTGFKWISRAGGLAYGYEEALGYLVNPDVIRDKDGISAAVDFLALASELASNGSTVAEHLLALAERFGGFASSQVSLRMTDLADIPRTMQALRDAPPAHIGGVRVSSIDDFIGGVRVSSIDDFIGGVRVSSIDDFIDGFGPFPASNILRIFTSDGSRVIVRPSGTEPKVKVYIDAVSTDGSGAERLAAAQAAVRVLHDGIRALLAG